MQTRVRFSWVTFFDGGHRLIVPLGDSRLVALACLLLGFLPGPALLVEQGRDIAGMVGYAKVGANQLSHTGPRPALTAKAKGFGPLL